MNKQLINYLFKHSDNAQQIKNLVIESYIASNFYDEDRIENNLINLLTVETNNICSKLKTSNDFNIDKIKEIVQTESPNIKIVDIKITYIDNILNKVYYTYSGHPYQYYKSIDNENDYRYNKTDEYNIGKPIDDIRNYNTSIDYYYHPEILINYKDENK